MSEFDEKIGMSSPGAVSTPLHILAPFVPTPHEVVDRMLRLAKVTSDDTVYDLGCGDGRIVIAAAKDYGTRGLGVDIEPHWIAECQSNARAAGVEQLVEFQQQDALSVDVSAATVVMFYLVHWSTEKLWSMIGKTASAGTRIVSHNFGISDWTPVRTEEFTDECGNSHTLYLWIVGDATC